MSGLAWLGTLALAFSESGLGVALLHDLRDWVDAEVEGGEFLRTVSADYFGASCVVAVLVHKYDGHIL